MSQPVGERLKSAREARGVSLQEACTFTKIQKQTLEAIEQGRIYETLDPVYARIFIKKYATFLGLDGVAVANEYQGVSDPAPEVQQPSVSPAQSAAPRAPSQPSSPRPSSPPLLVPALVALAAVVGIGFLGYMTVDLFHTLQKQRREAPAASAPAAKKKEPPVKLLVPASKPLKLTIEASSDVWLQVKADGTVIFQNVLAKGGRESWNAKNHLELWTGNAGSTKLFLNGKPLDGLGRGVRKGVKITRAGIQG